VAIVETPAGFQPNVDAVTSKIRTFFEHNLQNYRPDVAVVAARARGGPFDTDAPAIAAMLDDADLIFAGPGSPTYAARMLAGSRVLAALSERVHDGAALSLSSAAAIAFGRYVIPVYEIFKAGEDLDWRTGLDFFAPLGLNLTILPHWNNAEGGAELDTTHCFMGAERFELLRGLLPGPTILLAVDEHTACILDVDAGACEVRGAGQVYVLRPDGERAFGNGETFPSDVLRPAETLTPGIRPPSA
jgi:cyanophycinase-like exopeptidase